MTIHLYAAERPLFVPNQPNRRIPCAKHVLFHNFFFENSKKIVNPQNPLGWIQKNRYNQIFLKKNAACPGGAYGVSG